MEDPRIPPGQHSIPQNRVQSRKMNSGNEFSNAVRNCSNPVWFGRCIEGLRRPDTPGPRVKAWECAHRQVYRGTTTWRLRHAIYARSLWAQPGESGWHLVEYDYCRC